MKDLNKIIKDLIEKTQEIGIKIDFDNLDERINNNKDYIKAFPEVFKNEFKSTDDYKSLLDLLTNLWNNYPRKEFDGKTPNEKFSIGPKEKDIIRKFLEDAQENINPEEYDSIEEVENEIKKFQKKWIQKPQKELGGKTPMEIILEEREKLGNPNKDWRFETKISKINRKEEMNEENFKQILFDYACEKYGKEFQEFFGMFREEFPYDYDSLDEELYFKNFIDWLMIEKPLPTTGKTIVEEYVENSPDLSEEMKQKLLQIRNIIRSEFKVISKNKKDLKIEDVHSKKTYNVRLYSDNIKLNGGEILTGRIHPFGNFYRFAGAFLIKTPNLPFIQDTDMMMRLIDNREINRAENIILFNNSKLTAILNKMPFQWVDGICNQLSIKGYRKKEKSKMIAYKLYQDLPLILKNIPEKPKEALKLVLDKGGVVKYSLLRGYDDEINFWWNENPPRSTIGILRSYALLIVGKMAIENRLNKIALIPYEIRGKLKSLIS